MPYFGPPLPEQLDQIGGISPRAWAAAVGIDLRVVLVVYPVFELCRRPTADLGRKAKAAVPAQKVLDENTRGRKKPAVCLLARFVEINGGEGGSPGITYQAMAGGAAHSTTPSRPLCDPMYHNLPRASTTILRMPTLFEGSCTTRICSVFGSRRTTVSRPISLAHTIPPPSTVTA